MPACVIFDVDIRDMAQYPLFIQGLKAAIEAAGPEADPRRLQLGAAGRRRGAEPMIRG